MMCWICSPKAGHCSLCAEVSCAAGWGGERQRDVQGNWGEANAAGARWVYQWVCQMGVR